MTASATSRLESTFLAIALALALSSWAGVLLAEFGLLKPALVVASAFATGTLAIVGLRRTSGPGRSLGPADGARRSLAAAGVVVVCAAIFFPPYETFVWASDSTVYMGLGAEIARNDGYQLRDSLLAEMPLPARAEVFRNPMVLDATGRFARLPGGFGIPDIAEPTVVAGFSPVFPAFLAVIYELLGARAMPWVAPAFATLGMLALFLLGTRLGGVLAGLGAAALAAGMMPQIWFAKFPMPEIIAEFFVLAALFALTISLANNQGRWGGLAGWLLGLAALSKFELLPIVTIALATFVGLGLLWTGRGPRSTYVWMAGFFAIPLTHATLHYLLLPTHYALFVQQQISSNYAARTIQGLGWERFVFLAALFGIVAAIALSRIGGGVSANLKRRRWWGAAIVLAVVTYFLNGASPLEPPNTTGGLWAGLGRSLNWLGWYLPWPLAGALVVAGAVVLLARRRRSGGPAADAGAAVEVLTFVATLVLVAGLHMHRSPDTNEHIWTMRRFVPVVVPGLALLTATLIAAAFRHLAPRRGNIATAVVLVLLTAVVATPSLTLIGQPLWGGSLETSSSVAALFPQGSVVLMGVDLAGTHLATTLNYVHGVQTIVLAPAQLTPNTMGSLLTDWVEHGRPVFMITGDRALSFYAPGLSLVETQRSVLSVPILERTFDRRPRQIVEQRAPLTIARLLPREVTLAAIDIGNPADDAFFRLVGFHAAESDPGPPEATYRWTTGNAHILIPRVGAVKLTVSGARPDGMPPARLAIAVDGIVVHQDVEVSDGPMEIVVDLPLQGDLTPPADRRFTAPAAPSPGPRKLVLTSTSFNPARTLGSADDRRLGVRLYRLELLVESSAGDERNSR